MEVCGELGAGGITPSTGLVEACLELGAPAVMMMIRPHGGGFTYGADDLAVGTAYVMERNGGKPLYMYGISSGALKAGLFAGLRQEHHHCRNGVVGQIHRDIGIRVWPEDPIWVAIDPDLAFDRLEAQRPQAALDRVGPGIERQGGRHSHNQESHSKNGGRKLHRRRNLFLGQRPEHCTAYECITYVLNAGMSTADKTTVEEPRHHA